MKFSPGVYHLALFIFCLLIFIESSIPGENFPKVDFEFSDKIFHVIIYAILYVLFFYSLKNQSKYVNLQKFSPEFSIVFTALYGITDEVHQYFVPNRSCEFFDWVADVAGALIMYLFFKYIYQRKKSAALLLIVISLQGCSGPDESGQSNKPKIEIEMTEAWLDFMPVIIDDDRNRFGFVIKLKFTGRSLDTNYSVSDFVISLNNDVLTNKKHGKILENITDSGFVMNIIQSYNEKYLDKKKDYPDEVTFSFTVKKDSNVLKKFTTPKTQILKTQ